FVPIPKFAEQKYIAKILSDLDSKIELNQKMNKTLEAIGQAIFKHWFVDFEFPNEEGKQYKSSGGEMVYSEELGKEIPKGWAVIPLDQAAEFTRGFSYRGSEKSKTNGEYAFVTLNSVKEFGGFKREFSYITSDRVKEKHFVQLGDIVISNTEQTKTGTLLGYPALVEFPFQYEKGKGIFSHHITKATPKLENLKHYLYHHLFIYQQNAVKYHTGSVIWALDVANWSKNERIILPSQETLRKFESFVENIFLKSIENNLEVETLSRIRDSLLPKLMSGKIRVPIEAT
ncbi:MAG: restriction endonuclease subunit S, partial [Nitrososphaerota archaeon]